MGRCGSLARAWSLALVLGLAAPPTADAAGITAVRCLDCEAEVDGVQDPSDPFAQFDLGVAVVERSAPVSGWTPLSTSGVRLRPEYAMVERGDTVDALLASRGVRPDPYSRSLVALLNPALGDDLALHEGQALTLFRAERDEAPLSGGLEVALQPYRSERERLEQAVGQLEQWTTLTDQEARMAHQVADLQRRVLLTDLDQVQDARAIFETYNASLGQVHQARIRAPGEAPALPDVRAASQAASLEVRNNARRPVRSSIVVRAVGASQGPSAFCEVGWSIAGFSDFEASRAFEAYREPTPINVPASDLEVWIAQARSAPADAARRRVLKDQLLTGRPHLLDIPVDPGCRA